MNWRLTALLQIATVVALAFGCAKYLQAGALLTFGIVSLSLLPAWPIWLGNEEIEARANRTKLLKRAKLTGR